MSTFLAKGHNQVIGAKINYSTCANGSCKLFKNGPSKICGRHSFINLKQYGLYLSLILLAPFLNTLSQMSICTREDLFDSFLLFLYFLTFTHIIITVMRISQYMGLDNAYRTADSDLRFYIKVIH